MAYDPTAPHVLGRRVGVSMNTTADQSITIVLPPSLTKYVIDTILVTNASLSLALAVGGVYTAAAKGGTAIVAAVQVYSSLTTAVKVLNATIASTDIRTETTLFFSLTTAQGWRRLPTSLF